MIASERVTVSANDVTGRWQEQGSLYISFFSWPPVNRVENIEKEEEETMSTGERRDLQPH